jgi:nitroreductase
MERPAFLPLEGFREVPEGEMLRRSVAFREDLARRRSVRDFSRRPVPRAIIEECLRTANTAPSGANRQPWHFVAVTDPALKRRIREGAEEEERAFYGGRAPDEWLEALAPLGTGAEKPFLEDAPWLIAVFAEAWGTAPDGSRVKHYYVPESVGIATGFLIAAVHQAGLASLTHTPSPMGFLSEILGRPANERAYLLLVVGYPAEGCRVPAITKKSLGEVATFL